MPDRFRLLKPLKNAKFHLSLQMNVFEVSEQNFAYLSLKLRIFLDRGSYLPAGFADGKLWQT